MGVAGFTAALAFKAAALALIEAHGAEENSLPCAFRVALEYCNGESHPNLFGLRR
jgi:hypothetical protein